MYILTIASGKGGVGKTTTAVTLAAIYAEAGARVLLVDLDPQGSASAWLGAGPEGGGVLDVLTGDANLEKLARPSPWPGVDLVASAPGMAAADRILAGQPLAVLALRAAVARSAGRWGWVVLDCGPGAGILTTAAVAAAGGVLATIEPTTLGLGGVGDLAALVEGVGAHVHPAPALVGILACKVDPRRRLDRAMVEGARGRWGDLVLTSTIRATIRAPEAAALKQPLTVYDPAGGAAEDYRAAAVELAERMRKHDAQG